MPWKKGHRGRSVSRLNILIAITAAIIGLIYGYDLGSIASALMFLVPAFAVRLRTQGARPCWRRTCSPTSSSE